MRTILFAAVVVLLAATHPGVAQELCVETRPDCGLRENLTNAPGVAGPTSASGAVVEFSAPDKVASVIQDTVAAIGLRRRAAATERLAGLSTDLVRVTPAGEIHVYVILTEGRAEYVAQLESLGLRVELVLQEFALVQGWADAAIIDLLSRQPFVRHIRPPGYPMRQAAGAVKTQGDSILRADAARGTLGLTGLGVKVGVLSDGVTHRSAVAESGDLPASPGAKGRHRR